MSDPQLVKLLNDVMRRLDNLAQPEIGWTPHFLTEPYTNTTFDGDSFSTVAAHTKIENTSWSTTIPTNAKAIALNITIRDSGSAAATLIQFELFSTSTATNAALPAHAGGKTNDAFAANAGVVPCTDGDMWYKCTASGANTLDVWLRVVGYWT